MKTACILVPSPRHVFAGHPESPERFLLFPDLIHPPLPGDWLWLDAAAASETEILKVHTRDVLDTIQAAEKRAPSIIDEAPTFVSAGSLNAAFDAAGGTLAVSRAVLSGDANAGLALVRPPGHHAERRRSMGFCLVNNLAVAVQDALDAGVGRVMVVDFDAHHGNGTQDIFEDEARVAFLSTHQYGIYPGTGGLHSLPHARGRIANIPLPVYAGDQALLETMNQVAIPLADNFQPEMMFISAGFDAHWKDPLTALGLSTGGYNEVSRLLVSLAGNCCAGKIVFVLEGGYHPQYLKENVLAVMAALAGVPLVEDSAGPCPYPETDIQPILDRVREFHSLS